MRSTEFGTEFKSISFHLNEVDIWEIGLDLEKMCLNMGKVPDLGTESSIHQETGSQPGGVEVPKSNGTA